LNLYILTSTGIGIWESRRIRAHIKEKEEQEKAGLVLVDAEPTKDSGKNKKGGGKGGTLSVGGRIAWTTSDGPRGPQPPYHARGSALSPRVHEARQRLIRLAGFADIQGKFHDNTGNWRRDHTTAQLFERHGVFHDGEFVIGLLLLHLVLARAFGRLEEASSAFEIGATRFKDHLAALDFQFLQALVEFDDNVTFFHELALFEFPGGDDAGHCGAECDVKNGFCYAGDEGDLAGNCLRRNLQHREDDSEQEWATTERATEGATTERCPPRSGDEKLLLAYSHGVIECWGS